MRRGADECSAEEVEEGAGWLGWWWAEDVVAVEFFPAALGVCGGVVIIDAVV